MITYEKAVEILGEASRGQIAHNDNFHESCLMGQRAINTLVVIRDKLTQNTLERLGLDIIDYAIGSVSPS